MAERRPLRILQVGSGFPNWGGAEIHLVQLAEQLAMRNHDVTVAARPGGFVEAEAKKRGLQTLPATVKRQWDRQDYPVIQRFLLDRKVDVCQVHWSTDYVIAPWAARQAGVPVRLMSRHSPYPLKSAAGRFLYSRVLFDRVIALSESVRTTLTTQGIPASQVTTIHHGTDTEKFRQTTRSAESVREEWGIGDLDSRWLVVGIVGRMAPEKGILYLLEAAAKAQAASDTQIAVIVVGDGIQKDEIVASPHVSALREVGGRVVFAGFRADVNNAILALDALVLASTWEEPCAAVVQQAMALGKPVIGTRIGGTPEMVQDGVTGFLVPPSDASALSDALIQMARLPVAERSALGAAGQTRVDSQFTLRGMTSKIEALYYEILEAKKRRG